MAPDLSVPTDHEDGIEEFGLGPHPQSEATVGIPIEKCSLGRIESDVAGRNVTRIAINGKVIAIAARRQATDPI